MIPSCSSMYAFSSPKEDNLCITESDLNAPKYEEDRKAPWTKGRMNSSVINCKYRLCIDRSSGMPLIFFKCHQPMRIDHSNSRKCGDSFLVPDAIYVQRFDFYSVMDM